MSDPRRAAAAALIKQEQGGYANLVLAHALERFEGDGRDRAFLSAIFYGTVERMATIDYLLNLFLSRPLPQMDRTVRAVLRSGLYQARWMDGVPVHAAVSESVALCRRMGKAGAAGMVNAVLRRAAAVDLAVCAFRDELERLCVLYSVSRPVAQLLSRAYPQQAEAILTASFRRPAVCVRVNRLKIGPEQLACILAEEGVLSAPGPVTDSLVLENAGDVTKLRAFAKGLFHVQGAASQLACAALGAQPGWKVADLCAAPGGKTATLAQHLQGQGVVYSRDVRAGRVGLIRQLVRRLGLENVRTACADAAEYDDALAGCDGVLCDVPCSGLGTLAKKPDERYKDLQGLMQLQALQLRILTVGARYVRPGGRLVYSTCTLNPGENQEIAEEFLRSHPEFRALPLEGAPASACKTGEFVTLLPLDGLTDGFFIASFERLW